MAPEVTSLALGLGHPAYARLLVTGFGWARPGGSGREHGDGNGAGRSEKNASGTSAPCGRAKARGLLQAFDLRARRHRASTFSGEVLAGIARAKSELSDVHDQSAMSHKMSTARL
nr:hypothetical protein GCM10010200_005590 [Actinomadura rugatobispora]